MRANGANWNEDKCDNDPTTRSGFLVDVMSVMSIPWDSKDIPGDSFLGVSFWGSLWCSIRTLSPSSTSYSVIHWFSQWLAMTRMDQRSALSARIRKFSIAPFIFTILNSKMDPKLEFWENRHTEEEDRRWKYHLIGLLGKLDTTLTSLLCALGITVTWLYSPPTMAVW